MSTAKHHPDANGRYFCNKQLHIHRICAQSIKANKTMRIVSLLRMNDIIGLENGMESCGNHKIVIDRYLISFFPDTRELDDITNHIACQICK